MPPPSFEAEHDSKLLSLTVRLACFTDTHPPSVPLPLLRTSPLRVTLAPCSTINKGFVPFPLNPTESVLMMVTAMPVIVRVDWKVMFLVTTQVGPPVETHNSSLTKSVMSLKWVGKGVGPGVGPGVGLGVVGNGVGPGVGPGVGLEVIVGSRVL